MRDKTRAAETNEFCLVVTPDPEAAAQASEAIWEHFRALADETRRPLAAIVAELVDRSVEHRPLTPITVTAVLGTDSIRGEVADDGNLAPFEVALAG